MISVTEAQERVLTHAAALPPKPVALADAAGAVLAEDVRADRDSPPFDKALVDGYAVRLADLKGPGPHRLAVREEISAGHVPSGPLEPGQATLVMTGAPLPAGCDAVVMVEDARRDGPEVVLTPPKLKPNQGRLPRGQEWRSGDVVLERGSPLTPARVGMLASLGRPIVPVHRRPAVIIQPTGDELVEPDQVPGPGQIRNSNGAMLRALVVAEPDAVTLAPIARDEAQTLREALSRGLEADVLLVTGGVSAGTHDLVPGVLADLGVRVVFHKVRLKPGKPLLFGVGPERADGRPGGLVFGLPGNPVSGLVGFLLFVRPALAMMRGLRADEARPSPRTYALAAPFQHKGERPTYHPARLVAGHRGEVRVDPLPWAGSADLRAVAAADGFAHFPAGDRHHPAGDPVEFLPLS